MKLRNHHESSVQEPTLDEQIAQKRIGFAKQLSRSFTGIFHERAADKNEDEYKLLFTQKVVEAVGPVVSATNVDRYNELVQLETVERRSMLKQAMEKTRKLMMVSHTAGALVMQAGAVLGAEHAIGDTRLSTFAQYAAVGAAGILFGAGVNTQVGMMQADRLRFDDNAGLGEQTARAIIDPEDIAGNRNTENFLSMRLGDDMHDEFTAATDYISALNPATHIMPETEKRFTPTAA